MAPLFLFLALIIQGSFIYANEDVEKEEHETTSREILKDAPGEIDMKEFRAVDTDWFDIFNLPQGSLHSSSAVSKMAQVTASDKPIEEQLEDMKEMADQISKAIQHEMVNLLSYALRDYEKEMGENGLRKRRSAESPMDSSQLVMRLLKHIKNNNEYQNIAIEKMMSAQEIADKFGIEFNPDPEILSDLAVATTKQAEELTSIFQDVYPKNETTEVEFIPLNNETAVNASENSTYFTYAIHVPESEIIAHQNTPPSFEFAPEIIQEPRSSIHVHFEPHHNTHQNPHYNPHHHHSHYETQIVAPPPQHRAPVSHMPNFYEPAFTPIPDYYSSYSPYYQMEPITTTTTIFLPIEEQIELEPELVGEEFEETVSSKVIVDRGDEPGSATVNHVMTYTLSEKSHFRQPQIENIPQQMQYYFFLM